MKRSYEEDDDQKIDHFSNLQDDILDTICNTRVENEQWITVPGLFQVIQRCVRISLLSRYHRSWWLNRCVWYRDTQSIVDLALHECGDSMQRRQNFCRLVDHSDVLQETLRCHLIGDRVRELYFFKPILNEWKEHIHRSHEERGRSVVTSIIIKRLFERDSTLPCLFELLLALYNIWRADGMIKNICIKEPTSFSMLGQMCVYSDEEKEEEETSDYLVTLSYDTCIDTRRLRPLILNPSNYLAGTTVYTIHPYECAKLTAKELATHIKASQRLRLAIKECRNIIKPQKK